MNEDYTFTLSFPRSHTLSDTAKFKKQNPLLSTHQNKTVMFDFEKLVVYKKAKTFNSGVRFFIKSARLDPTTTDQLRRAAMSAVLNIAEGSGRFKDSVSVKCESEDYTFTLSFPHSHTLSDTARFKGQNPLLSTHKKQNRHV